MYLRAGSSGLEGAAVGSFLRSALAGLLLFEMCILSMAFCKGSHVSFVDSADCMRKTAYPGFVLIVDFFSSLSPCKALIDQLSRHGHPAGQCKSYHTAMPMQGTGRLPQIHLPLPCFAQWRPTSCEPLPASQSPPCPALSSLHPATLPFHLCLHPPHHHSHPLRRYCPRHRDHRLHQARPIQQAGEDVACALHLGAGGGQAGSWLVRSRGCCWASQPVIPRIGQDDWAGVPNAEPAIKSGGRDR
jgi:hypothetical protein